MFGLFVIGLYAMLFSPPIGACICTYAITAAILRPVITQHRRKNHHHIN